MKRFAILFLCSFYFLLASGLHLSLHYCGGKLHSIAAVETDEVGCCGKKMKTGKKKNCCKEKAFVYQIKNSHEGTVKPQLPKNNVSELLATLQSSSIEKFEATYSTRFFGCAHAPPNKSVSSLYLNICQFRI